MEIDPDFEDKTLDLGLCIICQEKCQEKLVEQPSCYEKVYDFIKQWATYNEAKYCKIWAKLQRFSPKDLEVKQATWHRSCYKTAVHSGMLNRAKDRYEKQLETPNAKKRRTKNREDLAVEVPTLTQKQLHIVRTLAFFVKAQPITSNLFIMYQRLLLVNHSDLLSKPLKMINFE